MDVMKGSDPTKATEAEVAKLPKKERPVPTQESNGKGKEKAEDAEEDQAEDDDDAAWLEKRRKAALGDAEDGTAAVENVSHVLTDIVTLQDVWADQYRITSTLVTSN